MPRPVPATYRSTRNAQRATRNARRAGYRGPGRDREQIMAANFDDRARTSPPKTEAIVAALLGVTTLASAWCAYQATLWNGQQIRELGRAGEMQFDAVRHTSMAMRAQLIDVATLVGYAQAEGRGDAKTAGFFVDHARREFRPALRGWIHDGTGDGPTGTPFERADYRVS